MTTFIEYTKKYDTEYIKKFNETFEDEIDEIPKREKSSKNIRRYLKIDNDEKDKVFTNVYMDFFRYKLTSIHL